MFTKYMSAYCHYQQQLLISCRFKSLWNNTVDCKMHIKAALIDLSGTLHVEDQPTPNAVNALKRLVFSLIKNIILKDFSFIDCASLV